jgi:hypothetical protein
MFRASTHGALHIKAMSMMHTKVIFVTAFGQQRASQNLNSASLE